MPEISIVVPLYNKEKHINRCLDSIFNQTFQDFEIIVVNDGSTDDSAKRVLEYVDSRIRLINKPNGGEASARNCGIKNANTEIIAFLDSDDQWLPGFLEKILYLRKEFSVAKVFTTAVYHNDGNRFAYPLTKRMYPDHWDGIIEPKAVFEIGFPFNSSSIAIDKETFTSFGYFDENLTIGTDSDMWFRLILLVPFAHSHEYLSEVFLDSQNRTHYEEIPTDISLIIQKSIDDAEKYGANITPNLRKIIDKEIIMSRYFFISSSVLRANRWENVRVFIKDNHLLKSIMESKRILPIQKFLAFIRIIYWFVLYLFQRLK